MTTATKPENNRLEEGELQALIEEARQRARRRRWGYLALAATALSVGGALYFGVVRDGGEPAGSSSVAPPVALTVSPQKVLPRDPYMGLACPTPNSFACDRVGVAVYLRRPAAEVRAAIGGRRFDLNVPDGWVGKRKTFFTGLLQPAGLQEDGPLKVTADDGPDRYIGGDTGVVAPVRLEIIARDGEVTITEIDVRLMGGYG